MIIQNRLKELGVSEAEINKILMRAYNILKSSYRDINALHGIYVIKVDDKLVLQVYLDKNAIDEHDLYVPNTTVGDVK
jgi:hypothetical protein